MPDRPVNVLAIRCENAFIGENWGTVNQGAEKPQPATASGNLQYVSISKTDLVQLLRPIADASHTRDRETSPPNSACFPGTRADVIHRIVAWADSSLLWNTHVLWLYGYVGCGKSAIALAIALKFERRKRLVGSFFFFRNTGDRSKMTKFATTLACQLAAAIPEAAPYIEKAVKAEPGLLQSSLVAQLRRLVYEPFKAASKRGCLLMTTLLKGPFLVVVDGLDECEDRQDVRAFIDDLLDFFKRNPFVPLRFLITSRVEQHIHSHLKSNQVDLKNLVDHCSRDDIDAFMSNCFAIEKLQNPVINAYIQEHGDWPAKADKGKLVDHIGGSFIFASALFKYIVDPTNDQSTPMERLPHTLNMNPGLDTLYAQTLSRSQHLPYFPHIISTLALLFEPLPVVGIAELLGIRTFEVIRVLVNLQAIIHIPGTDELPVTLCHTSLRDFLTTESRSGGFFAPPSYHLYLLHRCSTLHGGQQSGTAAALYSVKHCKEHLAQSVHLTAVVDGTVSWFPHTADALYTQILKNCQHLPHFIDIVSTIVSLFKPLPIARIAELLGIEDSEVSRVLVKLRAIVDIPESDDLPVTLSHASIRDFFISEGRSAAFFVPPSYHLKLAYRCFHLKMEHVLSDGGRSEYAYWRRWKSHSERCLEKVPEHIVLSELEQLMRSVSSESQSSSYIFSFNLLFFWIFLDDLPKPRQVLDILTQCTAFLALALESDAEPDRWLRQQFRSLASVEFLMATHAYTLTIQHEEAIALQRFVQRAEVAIREKCRNSPSDAKDRFNPKANPIEFVGYDHWIDIWTPMKAFREFLDVGTGRVIIEIAQDNSVSLEGGPNVLFNSTGNEDPERDVGVLSVKEVESLYELLGTSLVLAFVETVDHDEERAALSRWPYPELWSVK